MTVRTIRIGDTTFEYVATIYQGQVLYFTAGATVAVEKHDMRPGGTEFDFQVTSRATRNGQPEPIMAMQSSLDREFLESRVKTNLYGLPLSLGNGVEMVRQRRVELSYGELRPQIFHSKVETNPVAWYIWFKQAHYVGSAARPMLRAPTATAARTRLADQAQTRADASASAGAVTSGGNAHQANGRIEPLSIDALLRVYVPKGSPYRPLDRPFRGDVIFHETSWWDRIRNAMGRR